MVAVAELLNELPQQMPGVRSKIIDFTPNEIYRDYFNRLKIFGSPGSIYRISYVDLLEGRVPREVLLNKRVFVGATAAGLGDEVPTPLGAFAGVEFNAGAYHAVRLNAFIKSPTTLTHASLSLVAVIFFTLLLSRLSPALFFLLTFALIFSVSIVTTIVFYGWIFGFHPFRSYGVFCCSILCGVGVVLRWRYITCSKSSSSSNINRNMWVLVKRPLPISSTV